MPDQATMKWEAALELLAASGELGPGKVSVLRMTRVIDVDGGVPGRAAARLQY